ncbi:DoxX family protein [Kutzneria albida]|uniref:Putative secreted protein n=1 Tax=Kutzneria albida DSM 43870 TaxID=1449976 RepID=W5W339_9PSEU|nr:DoxX family protein [Kutzneria albida]AHH95195.1 putative secreted protein [Kutzneria albida DSM 43870]
MASTALPTTTGRTWHRTLLVLQVVMALFFLVAAAGPKLLGQEYAVQMFDQMGFGQWLRYLTGALELAGAIGLLIPRLAGLAALGLVGVMVGATLTQVLVLGAPAMAFTPVLFGLLLALVAWGRWSGVRALFTR